MNEGPDKGVALSAMRQAAVRSRWARPAVQPINGHAVIAAPAPAQIIKAPKHKAPPPKEPNGTPPCPYQAIVAAYEAAMPRNPRVRLLGDKTKTALRTRWAEDKARQNIQWWEQFFAYCNTCPFLIGAKTDFRADFQWLVLPTNFEKIINGRYE